MPPNSILSDGENGKFVICFYHQKKKKNLKKGEKKRKKRELIDRHGFNFQLEAPKQCRESQSQQRGAHASLFQAFSYPLLPLPPMSRSPAHTVFGFLNPFL